MTTTTTATMNDWIRPWYPGGEAGDHIDIECPELARQTSTPTEGSGWLDPKIGRVCEECVEQEDAPSWDAVCDTCDASMSEELDDEDTFDEDDAKNWKSEHECEPSIRIISPTAA